MIKKKLYIIKKITAAILAALLLLVQNPAVYGQTAPTAPTAPENTKEAPEAPPAPENEEVAPTPPPKPTPPPSPDSSDTTESDASGSDEGGASGQNQDLWTDPQSQNTGEGEVESSSSGGGGGGIVGDTEIETGDADNTATIVNDLNNNWIGTTGSSSDGGISVINKDNGSNSENTGSVKLVDNNDTTQDNTAKVVNNLDQDSNTGGNDASKNVGNSSIETGDANTSGTIVNAVNTNIDGVMVAEFNVVDDHLGDIILDFGAGCLIGCGGGDVLVKNSGNGADSENTGEVDSLANNNTFQGNDATVENNMTLESDSGNNTADKNTGGDSEIVTGDANVAANILNFANNNIAGGVIYAVVNIFGDLIGDIILPGGACCFGSATAENTGNGSGSTNTAEINQTTNNDTSQFNQVNIENNLVFDANTGDNSTVKNTNGSSSVETGDASIEGQVINVANTNIVGGDWWLVIVNEAGVWVGKILGANGNYYGGSEGFEFEVNEAGEIIVINSGNGADSTNTGTVNQETNNTVVQDNTANIVNNVNLSANTGGNSASQNTGGDSSIETGDANIIANIVNFVNNNITGGGRLYVTVVNVFGSWIGDFVGPGYEKENDEHYADASADGGSGAGGASENSSGAGGSSHGSHNENTSEEGGSVAQPSPTPVFSAGPLLASATVESGSIEDNGEEISFSGGNSGFGVETGGKQVINVNLAWLLVVLIPGYFALVLARKRRRQALVRHSSKE